MFKMMALLLTLMFGVVNVVYAYTKYFQVENATKSEASIKIEGRDSQHSKSKLVQAGGAVQIEVNFPPPILGIYTARFSFPNRDAFQVKCYVDPSDNKIVLQPIEHGIKKGQYECVSGSD